MKLCLIVDDVEVTRYTSEQFVAALGLETLTATSGDEALQMIRTKPVEVVLLDWHLRKDSGLDLIAKIKSVSPHIKTIIFSGVEGPEKRAEALKAGADSFLEKPTTKAKIQACFQEVGVL